MKIPQTLLFCVAATVCRSRVIHHGRVATPVTFGRIRIFLDAQMLAANATDLETLAIHAETTTRDSPRRVRQLASELKSKALTAALGLRKRGDDLTDILFRNTTTPTSLVRVTRAVPAMAIGAGIGIGIGLAAIGFATANRVAIANLEQKMAAQDERIDDLITTVKARNIMIDNDIKALNQTMGALAEAMDEREGIRLLDEMRTRMRLMVHRGQQRQKDFERAIYTAFHGGLDPALVPLADLSRGLDNVKAYGQLQGLKPVDMAVLETAFSMPLTVSTNATGLSLVIEVPMIPQDLEPLDLLEAKHAPQHLDNLTSVDLDLSDGLILTDPQRRYHREVTAADLSLCPQFKDFRFCQFTLLQKEPTSCLAAYVLHDIPKVKALCKRTFSRKTFHIDDNGDYLDISSHSDTILRKECPHNASQQAVYRTGGERQRISLETGCYLDSPEAALFTVGREIETEESVAPALDLEDLLDGITVEVAAAAVHAIAHLKNVTDLTIPMNEVLTHMYEKRKSVKDQRENNLTVIAIVIGSAGLFMAFLVCVSISSRVTYLRYRVQRATPPTANNDN